MGNLFLDRWTYETWTFGGLGRNREVICIRWKESSNVWGYRSHWLVEIILQHQLASGFQYKTVSQAFETTTEYFGANWTSRWNKMIVLNMFLSQPTTGHFPVEDGSHGSKSFPPCPLDLTNSKSPAQQHFVLLLHAARYRTGYVSNFLSSFISLSNATPASTSGQSSSPHWV